MKKCLCLVAVLALAAGAGFAMEPLRTGTVEHRGFSTPHPYASSGADEALLTWADQIVEPGSSYIRLHFSRFELAPGDFVVVRSPHQEQQYTYTGNGRHGLGTEPGGFYASILWGDTAIVELYSTGDGSAYGFDVDHYYRGFTEAELAYFFSTGLSDIKPLPEPTGEESACTSIDYQNAICYETTDPEIYDKARAVIRLHIGGSACTGWLIGNAGHVMTNEHCIGSQSSLDSTDFELMAEGTTCGQNCDSWGACPGPIEATGGTVVQIDAPLDYSLVIPDTSTHGGTDLPATYGFMKLRAAGATLDERLYHPQHPNVYGKKLMVNSTYPDDVDGWPRVVSRSEVPCSGGPGDIGYWSDTAGGSSGSPVLAFADHKVVALHHCRGSNFCSSGNPSTDDPNRGVPIEAVIADLGPNVPPGALCDAYAGPANFTAVASADNTVALSWDAVTGSGITYTVSRSYGACPASDPEVIAEGLTTTTYTDLTVSGGETYAYFVTAMDDEGCESDASACADVTATGLCTRAPDFAGVATADNLYGMECGVEVTWNDAVVHCGGSVSYNIYRSTTEDFEPGPANLVASCLTGTSWTDTLVESGYEYFYTVRAEDDTGNGAGPCGAGNEDQNSDELSTVPTGPDSVFFADDMEGGPAQWTTYAGPNDPGGTTPWSIVTSDAHSPTHSFFIAELNSVKDQALQMANPVTVSAGDLSFWHRVQTEDGYDGGVLEYSTDGGTTWHDILAGDGGSVPANASRFLVGGYNDTLSTGFSNPLPGRDAWSGEIAWGETIVDLDDFAGETVHFRWRLGCDSSVSDVGWWVDDVTIIQGSSCVAAGSLIFADGFESGGTTMWTTSTP